MRRTMMNFLRRSTAIQFQATPAVQIPTRTYPPTAAAAFGGASAYAAFSSGSPPPPPPYPMYDTLFCSMTWDEEPEKNNERFYYVKEALNAMERAEYWEWVAWGNRSESFPRPNRMSEDEIEIWAKEVETERAEGETWDLSRKVDFWMYEAMYWDRDATMWKNFACG